MFLHCHCEPEGSGNFFLYMTLGEIASIIRLQGLIFSFLQK